MKRGGIVVAAAFVLGALTSFAQGWLPESFAPFANSASGWTVLTGSLLWWARVPAKCSAGLGAAAFVLLVLGYTAASELRGLSYSPLTWSLIGVVAGPFVGLAVAWLRHNDLRAALGVAVLAGIGLGEAGYGLTVVADTTSPAYWITVGLVSLSLLAAVVGTRLRDLRGVAVAIGATALVAVAFNVCYRML